MSKGTDDTAKLLRECSAGIKMAIASIDEVMPYVRDGGLSDLLRNSKKNHQALEAEAHRQLTEADCEDKEPNCMAKGMSWLKINVKMAWEPDSGEVADLMTDGCGMGIKSLSRYVNQYPTASRNAKDLAARTVTEEDGLVMNLRKFL